MREKNSILSLDLWIMISALIICLSGSSAIEKVRTPMFICTGFLMLFKYINKRKFSKNFILWMIWLLAIASFSFFSYDIKSSWEYIAIYFVGILLIENEFSVEKMKKMIRIIKVVTLIVSVSVILAYFLPNFMNTFWFTVSIHKSSALTRIYQEQSVIKAFSGFAGERSEAAFLINVGIAAMAADTKDSRFLTKKNLIYIIIYILALFLTGKRMLLLIAAIELLIANSLIDKKMGTIKIVIFGIVAIILIAVAVEYIPAVQHTIERFQISDSSDVSNGRTKLWNYAFQMFEERPFIGGGIGAYNEYAFQKGYRYHGGRWNYHNHCVFIQALGEMGILIAVYWIFLLLKGLYDAYTEIKKNDTLEKSIFIFAFMLELLIVMYGMTGNTLYYDNQIAVYFLAVCFTQSMRKCQREKERNE